MPPKVLAKPDKATGILQVNAATRAAASAPKGPAPRLKLEIRRLPPGLTLTEFEDILGDEWKLGNGKVDWREYRQGKMKQALGKVPEQSRCYLHLVNDTAVKELETRFLAVLWQDKAGTHKNPDLKHLPPSLEYAASQRTPLSTKPRTDSRQGTIDQDPEFMAFLQAETEAITKPAALDAVGAEKKDADKVEIKTTPLIEALRDKKASKAKKAEEAKAEKKDAKGHARTDSKDASAAKPDAKASAPKVDAKDDKTAKQKVEQVSKEAVKALNKQVASKQQQAHQRPASPQQQKGAPQQQPQPKKQPPTHPKKGAPNVAQGPKPANAVPTPAKVANGDKATSSAIANASAATSQAPTGPRAQREPRNRGGVDGIKKMLQKDLGIKPKPITNAPNAPAAGSAASSVPTSPAPQNRNANPQKQPASPAPSSPATHKPPPTAPKAQQAQQAQSVPTASSSKAYLKHANPSQGMTEILIQQALSQYGSVKSVTIDPRKGTAIALFNDAESLKKALEAKRVPVAQGTVELLEFKDRAGGGNMRGGFRGGRGGRGGARGGAPAPASPAPAAAPKSAQAT